MPRVRLRAALFSSKKGVAVLSQLLKLALAASVIGVTGCCSCLHKKAKPAAAAVGRDDNSAGDLAPPSDYRKARLASAMRGLRYDSGRVERDEPAASQVIAGVADAQASYERGLVELELNRRVEAIEAFTHAVLIDPDVAEYYEGLGTALVYKRHEQEGVAAFRTALDVDSELASARFKLADALQRTGDRAGAIEQFRELIDAQPDHAEAHARLAVLLYYAEDNAGAWRHVHDAEALGGSVPPQFRVLLARQMTEPAE